MRMFQMTLVASLLLAGTSFADTINVPGDYPTIQGAVDAAADGDEIIVSPGTYSVGNTYEVVKMGGKAVWLHSSDGPETTIIDGSGDRRGIACVLGEGPGTIIEGFTIRNCDDGPDQGVGGGILVASDSSPTIRGCHVISSSAWWGGGIGIESSNPVFENCTISVCSSGYLGGGIALLSGSPVFESCTISSCSSDYGGGFGVDVGEGDAANPSFISCEMTGNTAKDGGGFYFENSHGLVEDCVVSGNSSTDEGGGVHVSYDSEVSISDCYISNNSSGVDPGGGIWNGLGGTSIVGGTTVCANSPGQIHGSWTDAGGNVVSAVCPVTLTVALDGSGDFTSIQSAIDAASSGDTILVEPGTYNEHEVNTNGKSVFIVGSVDSEGMPASVIDAAGSSQNVLLIRNGESPWYSNFIITNGSAGNGGAAFIDNASSPRFANCHFLNNTAGNESGALLCIDASLVLSKCLFTGNTAGHQGGAVGLFGTSHLQCYDSHFENNETGSGSGGGAISCDPGTSVEIENTSFANNIAGRAGGGIAIEANVNALIRDCVFTNNEALDAGGLYAHNCSPTVDSCQFVGNRCLNRGGGIGFFDGSGGSIVNCQILDNEVTAGYPSSYGGGIYLADSSPLITGCLVSGNSDPHAGGGLSASNSDAVLTSCVITDNSGAHGGVYLYQSAPQLIDCLIVENSGTATGGVAMDSSTPSFEGCAVVGNTGAECGGINDLGASTSSLLNTAVCGNAKGQVCDNYTDLGGNTVEEVCTDADGDGIADSYDNCYLYNPKQLDCNGNGIGDVCDLADQTSYDIDQNGVPDECDPDCDGDGIPDGADGPDFDQDGIPDNCEPDCNNNTIPDDFEIEQGWTADCNANGIPDECDLWDVTYDCDENGLIDSCEIAKNPALDCDADGNLDICVPLDDTTDCDGNGLLDICELLEDPSLDCNMNGVIDSCDLEQDPTPDCDGNGLFDSCEIEANPDLDCDGSGVLDTCELVYEYTERAKILASDGDVEDNFGISISMDGDLALVGARHQDDLGTDSGGVYIFERTDDWSWQEVGQFYGSDTVEGDVFGVGVSLDGSRAAIGASGDDAQGGYRTGSVYIFEQDSDGVWIEVDKISAPAGLVNNVFGDDVSLDGDRLLIGVTLDDDVANNAGAAFIYERNAKGEWIQQAKLLASDGQEAHYFGNCVALDGDTAVIAASKYDGDIGLVYQYARQSDGTWVEVGRVALFDGVSGDVLGQDVGLSGDLLMVSSFRDGGLVHIFEQAEIGDWTEVDRLSSSDIEPGDSFGRGLTFQGNTLLAAAEGDTNDGGEGAGAFYVFALTSELDCDANKIIDACEIDTDPSLDCDGDSILDACALADGLVEDCDADGLIDSCEITADPLLDQNGNGLLDDCECLGDIAGGGEIGEGDGVIDVNDVLAIIGLWGTAGPIGDVNFDGVVNVNDLLMLLEEWGEDCS